MKEVSFNSLEQLIEGARILSDAVSSTLGPKGRTVIIENPSPIVTKDGVTVASHLTLENPQQNLAVSIIKQAAKRTAATAGDGTTTATLLSYAFLKELYPLLSTHSPIEVKRTLDNFISEALRYLADKSTPMTIDAVYEIAHIASNNDVSIASIIQTAYSKVGLDGMIVLEESKSTSSYLKMAEGASFPRGYISRYFVTDTKKNEVVLDNPYVLITDAKLNSISELVPIFNKVAASKSSLLVVADEVEGQVLNALATNSLTKVLPACAIKAPSFGEARGDQLTDMAVLCSTSVISLNKNQRFEDLELSDLGRADKIIVRKEETIVLSSPDPKKIEERVFEIDRLISENTDATGAPIESEYIVNQLYQRRARLLSKIAQIFIGAPTEAELREKKDRLDDALRATRSSIALGYLPGGGTSFLKLQSLLNPNNLIEAAISRALEYPTRKIASNASTSPDVVIKTIADTSQGYNALQGTYCDLYTEGVIDPTLVLSQALSNAASAASMILLSSTVITNIDRTPPYSPGTLDEYASSY